MDRKTLHILWNCQVFARLIQRDMVVFHDRFNRRLFSVSVWVVMTLVVFQYIGLGDVSRSIGVFMGCANVVCWGFFEVIDNINFMIADLEGNRSLTFLFSLPLPHSLLLCRTALSNALQGAAISIFVLPFSKLLLGKDFCLASFSLFRFLTIFFLANLFFGFFSLFMTYLILEYGKGWGRLFFPLWFLGCYQFTWERVAAKSTLAAYALLLNPFTYCMEGVRASVMGQEGYLPFGLCCTALIFFTVTAGVVGIRGMKKRLDCL